MIWEKIEFKLKINEIKSLISHTISANAIECIECSSDTLKACLSSQFIQYKKLPLVQCSANVKSCFTKLQSNQKSFFF